MKRPIASMLVESGAGEELRDVTVTLRMTGDDVTVRAPMPHGPSRPIRLLPLFQAITDAVVDRAEQASARRGEPISCKAGCGACCRQLVPISETETHFIRDLVEDLSPERRRVVERRLAAARARVAEAGILERLLHPGVLDETQYTELAFAYFNLGIACPFLEEESCSIHADRPVLCREFVVSSPAAHCADPNAGLVKRLVLEGEVSQALNELEPHEQPERGVRWIPLSLAPDWANEHPDLAPPQPTEALLSRSLELVKKHSIATSHPVKKRKKGR